MLRLRHLNDYRESKKFLRGQTLVIVLLVMVVSLTVGLAVSTRTIGTLRQTTFTSQAAAALAAAEAGAEDALKRLGDSTDSCAANVRSLSFSCSTAYDSVTKKYIQANVTTCGANTVFTKASTSGASFSYCVSRGGGSGDDYPIDLEKDTTSQVSLQGYSGTSVNVCWFITGFDATPEPALELILLSGIDILNKYALDPNSASRGNGFSLPAGPAITPYKYCQSLTGLVSPVLLRIRSLYNNVSVAVKPQTGVSLPFQAYRIESVGSIGGVYKKVRVTRTLPSLPTIFDFGLFSGSETEPIRNQ